MSVNRRAAKRDLNEAPIINALRAVGATVDQLSSRGTPDLLVGFRGDNYLLEVKRGKAKLTPDEIVWHDTWQGQKAIVRTIDDALVIIGAVEA